MATPHPPRVIATLRNTRVEVRSHHTGTQLVLVAPGPRIIAREPAPSPSPTQAEKLAFKKRYVGPSQPTRSHTDAEHAALLRTLDELQS